MLQLVILICSINAFVYGTRTAQNGHLLLSGISMAARDFEREVVQVASKIADLQVQHNGRPDLVISRYTVPVYLYVHEATRISQSPVYLALNAQPYDTNSGSSPGYLQLLEIYDERYSVPIANFSLGNINGYPAHIQPFDPMHTLDRHNVIGGLQDSSAKKLETMMRLSLVFVESIRFKSVREAVRDALRSQGMVDFRNHMHLLRNLGSNTDGIVRSNQQTNGNIQPQQSKGVILHLCSAR
jgi:hypothetical protein